ncbi:MAG: hypothetical protein KF760_29195 [Candidatus Eremiobacteraeota bacterium]|nr:hypothetical protein [Candidatus Eremiobacteraeota bacterium]MCW5865950.1 hypothetical protein [Candidatus Eremiobacteraeota bacterium]
MKILGSSLALVLVSVPQGAPPPAPASAPAPLDKVEINAGDRLAQATLDAAATFRPKANERYCYRYVKMGMKTALGVTLTGGHAYQAAAQLAHSPCFTELGKPVRTLHPEDLPRGTVVVWSPRKKHSSGHIFVSLGDGREVSDRIRTINVRYGSVARIFVPSNECAR